MTCVSFFYDLSSEVCKDFVCKFSRYATLSSSAFDTVTLSLLIREQKSADKILQNPNMFLSSP